MAGNDFCNGFNETARAAIFEGLYHSPFASLIPAARQWYGERGALVLKRRHGQLYVDGVCIDSDEGSRQGCGWGPLLFCVGGQRTLTLAQRAHPDVLFLVYIDDVYCFHPDDPEEAWRAMETLRRLSRERNADSPSGAMQRPRVAPDCQS